LKGELIFVNKQTDDGSVSDLLEGKMAWVINSQGKKRWYLRQSNVQLAED